MGWPGEAAALACCGAKERQASGGFSDSSLACQCCCRSRIRSASATASRSCCSSPYSRFKCPGSIDAKASAVEITHGCGRNSPGSNGLIRMRWGSPQEKPDCNASPAALLVARPAPQPRGSGFFVDPGQTGTPAQSQAGEMEPTSWTRMLSAIFTMAVAACAIYIILFEM
jgi:hypothetical protein